MVEVFDFQKNFITGKETRKSKFKDNSMTKGVATIELFDKDNNLVEKTVSNNFINNIYDGAYIYKHISNMLSNLSYESAKILNGDQFGQIHLRSGDFEEDKNTLFMRGEVVGWCPRDNTNAGTDTTRGVYNPTESFKELTYDGYMHYHMVYDFTTAQGNGTINHVYWTPTIRDNTKQAVGALSFLNLDYVASFKNTVDTGISKVNLSIDVKGDLYVYKNSKYYKVQNRDRLLNGFELSIIDENQPVDKIKSQVQRINSDFYVDYESSYNMGTNTTRTCNLTLKLVKTNTDEVQKTVSFDIINDFTSIKEWSDKATSSYAYAEFRGVKACTESGNVYMEIYLNGGTIQAIGSDGNPTGSTHSSRTYTVCYNIFKDSWIIQPNIKDYLCYSFGSNGSYLPASVCIKIEDDKHMLFKLNASETKYSILDEKEMQIKRDISVENIYMSSGYSLDSSYINFKFGYDYNSNTFIGVSGFYDNRICLTRFVPYSSHTKLPSPVTKTNTTTMKVTYDYYIQVPNMFAEKGKEFEWDIEG